MRRRSCLQSICLVAVFAFTIPIFAQEISPRETIRASDRKAPGWSPAANLGVNLSLSSMSHVVGQTEGTSESFGLNLRSAYNYSDEDQEWQNIFSYAGLATKTPNISTYIKSGDEAKIESLYLHGFPSAPQFGPYLRVFAKAPVFYGQDVRPSPVLYKVRYLDGKTAQQTDSTFRLTNGFKPLSTRESAGFFWKAHDDGKVRIDLRLGLGADQIQSGGQFTVTGSNPDGSVNVDELPSVSQFGVEATVSAKGVIDDRTGWALGVESLTPFASNKPADDKRDPIRLTTAEAFARIGSNITNWASVSYDYKFNLQPRLLERAQQSHLLVLNLNYNFF